MASQPPIPRSMPAGDKEPQQPAQEGVRRSGRVKKNIPTYSNPETIHRSPREGDRGTPGPRNKSPARSWGEMSSSESTSSFSSRVVAMLREYEDAGKALTQLKEELREARVLNTRASNKERPATSQRFKALRDEVVRLVLLREGIEKSAGPFLERFKNQRRFSEMKGLNTSGEPPASVLSEEEEEDEEVTGVSGAGASEGQSWSSSGLPAGQRTPTAEAGVSGEEEEGGLLREIRLLESPVDLTQFSFGEDKLVEETGKRKKKKTGGAAQEVVSYKGGRAASTSSSSSSSSSLSSTSSSLSSTSSSSSLSSTTCSSSLSSTTCSSSLSSTTCSSSLSSTTTSMGLLSYVASFLPEVSWSPWGSVDSFLQGLVGACAVSVLYNLMKVHLYIMCLNDPERQKKAARFGSSPGLGDLLHLLLLTFIYSLLGPRVGALVVLEFSLRAVSMILSLHKGRRSSQLFLLCQFSLGCGVTCSLDYLHEGAPHRTWNLLLAVGLAGLIVWQTRRMCRHVAAMYQLHSSKRYCGVCLSLLASWHDIPTVLWRALKVAFLVSDLAAVAVINRDFLSTAEAVRFWTPLTICYTLLVIYMQEEQHQNPTEQMAYQTVFVRMGGLLILMMTVGRWADILHIFISLIGELWCLIHAGMMLDVCREEDYAERLSTAKKVSKPRNMRTETTLEE